MPASGPRGTPGGSATLRGAWNSTTSYQPLDEVTFNNSSYIASSANTNQQPDQHPESWQVVALQGPQGATGCDRSDLCPIAASIASKTRVFSLSAQSATFRVTAAPLLRKRFQAAAGAAPEPVPGWATGAQAEATDSGCAGAEMRGFQAETVEYMRTGVWGARN